MAKVRVDGKVGDVGAAVTPPSRRLPHLYLIDKIKLLDSAPVQVRARVLCKRYFVALTILPRGGDMRVVHSFLRNPTTFEWQKSLLTTIRDTKFMSVGIYSSSSMFSDRRQDGVRSV